MSDSDWVYCGDRLPDNRTWVWIFGDDGTTYVKFGYVVNLWPKADWLDWYVARTDGTIIPMYGVTHWQPIEIPKPPEPPEREK